jgi:hypothetical protein
MDTEQDSITDEDLYDSATEVPVAPEPEVKEDRARDEKGRFAAKEEVQEETPPVAEAQPELPKEEKVDHRIPLTELLNEREKRQSEARRAEQLQRELEALRQQMQPPKERQPVPDQFQNPDAYNDYWEQRIAEMETRRVAELRQFKAETSLERAHDKYGKVFEAAYEYTMQNPDVAKHVANAPNPGEAMVSWYKREQAVKVVGDDPEAYVQKRLEEALNDPQYLAKAIEKARSAASTQPTQVKLPPSLNKATSAGRPDDSDGMSDRGLYQHATGR